MYDRAEKVLPLGVSSNFRTYEPYPDLHPASPGLEDVGRGRARIHGLLHVLRRPDGGPREPGHGGGARQSGGRGHALRDAPRPRDARRRADLRALLPGADALHELGLRVDDARDPPGSDLHGPGQDPEVRGRLPRRPRHRAGVGEAAQAQGRARARHPRSLPGPGHPGALHREHRSWRSGTTSRRPRGPLERHDERGRRRHRRAGDDERGRDGPSGRLPPGAARALRRVRLPADLRRGEDGGEAGLGRRPGEVQGQGRHRVPGQGHRRRPSPRRVRSARARS